MVTNGKYSFDSGKDKIKGKTIGYRHLQCLLIFLGFALLFAMRVNLSVAIVAMMDNKGANPDFPEYAWSQKTKSHILSSFFCGYILVQIPAGGWARRFGGRLLLILSVMMSSIFALLTPLMVNLGGWASLCTLRFCQGLFQGVTLPTIATLMSKWAPIEERSAMQTICYSGAQLGIVLMLATSGVLCSSSWGWPSTFYLPGILGLLWAGFWFIFGASTPRECKHISADERAMIEESLGHDKPQDEQMPLHAVPWKKMFTSKPFLVLVVNHCTSNWCFWTLLTQIPSYISSVLGKDIKSNAILSSLPYVTMLALSLLLCPLASWLEKSQILNATVSRKIFNTIGQWIPVVSLISLGYLRADQGDLAIALLTTTVTISTIAHFGFSVNHLDLAPNFAGTLMGIVNCSANVMSIIAPLVVGYVVTDTSNIYQWRIIFTVAGCMSFSGNLMFLIFGTAKVQHWNEPPRAGREAEPLNELINDAKKDEECTEEGEARV
ncbi:PREDICTED: putative inorganic phosphate cotransporter [Rhagoletis zephyria]|uniref:putative inorganic phosphate cotransporter n=1 Tax=Rhagoletis zephyria TaxID=28612 RepID=UPI0008113CA5|nr:PREDICTED: putative inorganic phosphate cotransporter [Rhagoletis zephyria]